MIFVSSLGFSPDGRYLMASAQSDDVQVWDLLEDGASFKLPTGRDFVTHLAMSPDGKRIAAAGGWGGFRIFTRDEEGIFRATISFKKDVSKWKLEGMEFTGNDTFVGFTRRRVIAMNAETGDRLTDRTIYSSAAISATTQTFWYRITGDVLVMESSSAAEGRVPLLVIPPSHSPGYGGATMSYPLAAYGDYVVWGCENGQVVIVKVNMRSLAPGPDGNFGKRICLVDPDSKP